jgi:hypothetical protein
MVTFSSESAQRAATSTPASGTRQRPVTVQTPTAVQSRTNSPGAGQAQVASPGSHLAGAPVGHQSSQEKLQGATPVFIPVDLGTANIGGRVYSTGTDDIILTILTPSGWGETRTVVVGGKTLVMPNPNISAFNDAIYILSPGQARFVASNCQHGRQVNLGKLPPGEIVFAISTPQRNVFRTGDGSRNPDALPHASIKTFRSGPIEVWFEDLSGLARTQSDRDFNDAVFQLSGGVSDNNGVAELLKTIKEQKGELRDAAIAALRQANPKAATIAGF